MIANMITQVRVKGKVGRLGERSREGAGWQAVEPDTGIHLAPRLLHSELG